MALDAMTHVFVTRFRRRNNRDPFAALCPFLRVTAFSAANAANHQHNAASRIVRRHTPIQAQVAERTGKLVLDYCASMMPRQKGGHDAV